MWYVAVILCSFTLLVSEKNIRSYQGVKFPLNRHIFGFCKGAVSGAQCFAVEGSTP